jgi:Putative transposase/Transposase zinc-binding domain
MANIQEIFQKYGEKYKKNRIIEVVQEKIIKAIRNCRTAIMGNLFKLCDDCGYEEVSYCSCRNRHCPKCQNYAKEKWIVKKKADLLNVRYFHAVFTIPSELGNITRFNKEKMYDILFKSVSETLKTLGKDKQWLGAEIGAMLILHTWTQTMLFHPHLHVLIPGGGLNENGFWIYGSKKFFIPVKVLSKVFRGKFMHYFLKEMETGELNLPGELSPLKLEAELKTFRISMYKKKWYVYCKRTFNGPDAVIEYLGRYSHSICISDSRIVSISDNSDGSTDDGNVTFKYRDNKQRGEQKQLTISGVEFIRRYMWHTLPSGFMKIRYIGILSNRNKTTKLRKCQEATGILEKALEYRNITKEMILQKVCKGKAFICPACGGENFKLLGSDTPNLVNTA